MKDSIFSTSTVVPLMQDVAAADNQKVFHSLKYRGVFNEE
jgi:hypothetical protein